MKQSKKDLITQKSIYKQYRCIYIKCDEERNKTFIELNDFKFCEKNETKQKRFRNLKIKL